MSNRKRQAKGFRLTPVSMVFILTLVNFLVAVALVASGLESELATSFIDACTDAAKVGFGGLVALISSERGK